MRSRFQSTQDGKLVKVFFFIRRRQNGECDVMNFKQIFFDKRSNVVSGIQNLRLLPVTLNFELEQIDISRRHSN